MLGFELLLSNTPYFLPFKAEQPLHCSQAAGMGLSGVECGGVEKSL